MTDFEPSLEPPRTSYPPGVQYSTLGLLAILTATSIILAAYFGVGRSLGMNNMEILARGFTGFLYQLPQILVWIAGVAWALRSDLLPRSVVRLVVVGLCGLLFTVLLSGMVRMVLIQQMISNTMDPDTFGWWNLTFGVFSSLVCAVWWVLILMAIFRGRNEISPTAQSSRESPQ